MPDKTIEIEIRPAGFPDDLPAAISLFREYAATLEIGLAFQHFEEEVADLPGKYSPPDGRLFVACDGASPIGCAALRPLNGGTCELKRFFVRPAFRGLGIGRRLIAELLAEASKAGYSRVCLDTLPSMRQATRLYESLGFRDTEPYCDNPVAGARFLSLELTG